MQLIYFIQNNSEKLMLLLWQHFYIFFASMVFALALGLTLAILIARDETSRFSGTVLTITGAAQAVPPLAVIALVFIVVGIGALPSMIALVLYSLVPIVFNTTSGLINVPPHIIEAGRGMGYTDRQILWKIKIPIAMPVIFAGIRSASTINIGTATIASFIGGGGLGDFIFMGLKLYRSDMIVTGALFVALMAIVIDFFLARLGSLLSPGSSA